MAQTLISPARSHVAQGGVRHRPQGVDEFWPEVSAAPESPRHLHRALKLILS